MKRDWCEQHNRGSLEATAGLCPECQQETIQRLTRKLEAFVENDNANMRANAELIAERDNLKSLMKRREQFILDLLWTVEEKHEALERVIAGEWDARHKLEVALTAKDKAMNELFDRLYAAGVDCSDLIS